MRILVTNPTGKIGRRIVPELLAPEFSVRVIVRDPARLPHEIRQQVEIVLGSADDVATLRRALDDVEALFWCVPTEPLHEKNVEQHYERFAVAAWQAIRQGQTPRVVTISASGTIRPGRISGLHAMEDILNESAAAVRHLSCGFFMENLLAQARSIRDQGVISYPLPGHIPIPMVSVESIADAALRWLVRRDWNGIQHVAVCGSNKFSFNQTASVIERTLERPVRYLEASADDYVRTLVEQGASADYARSQVEMFTALTEDVTRGATHEADSATPANLAVWTEKDLLPSIESLGLHSETAAVATRAWLTGSAPR
jgi:uncharacterized protein YbjT (DUF2867 family)